MTSRNLMRETSLTTFKPIDEEEHLSSEDPSSSRSHSLTTTTSQRALTQIRTTGLFGRKSSSNFRNTKTNDDNIASTRDICIIFCRDEIYRERVEICKHYYY